MGTTGQSITLANSIIGVGILAMPFCFQQCGVVLATLILLSMGLVSRLCCYFLLKSALIARRRNFEFLAFHVFGSTGKLLVELGIIGFLMGTCIAYFVVVGDLGPQIVSKIFNINQSHILRTAIMVIVSLVCVLPLGLLRNVDSLSNVSAATICFYFCLVIKVIAEAASQMFSSENSDWHTRIEMWKPSGLLQCVPIFSMALFCQTQLFEIFESLPSVSLEKMNIVTKNAINICTGVYFTLGLFGYIAFSSQNISGNILISLSPTMASDVIKLGFVMSVAFSFPLIIFPCRASLYSFLYKKVHSSHHDHIINHSIPAISFRCITVAIIAVSLFISLLLPDIELVLGLVGSTIGVLICVVFPAACFVNITFKDTNERLLAKGIVVLGLIILVLGTYANLEAAENKHDKYDEKLITQERIDKIVEDFFKERERPEDLVEKTLQAGKHDTINIPDHNNDIIKEDSVVQPPNPIPPESNENPPEKALVQNKPKLKVIPPVPISKKNNEQALKIISELHPKDVQTKLNEAKLINGEGNVILKDEKTNVILEDEKSNVILKDEIIKEEKLKEPSPPDEDKLHIIKQQKLIETMKQHGEEQKELMKEIYDDIIKAKQEIQQNKNEAESNDAKKIAVESIKQIANIAIQSIGGATEKPIGHDKDSKKSERLEQLTNEAVQEIAKKAVETIEAIKEIKENPENKIDKLENSPVKETKNEDAKPQMEEKQLPNDPLQNMIQNNNIQPNPLKSNVDDKVKQDNIIKHSPVGSKLDQEIDIVVKPEQPQASDNAQVLDESDKAEKVPPLSNKQHKIVDSNPNLPEKKSDHSVDEIKIYKQNEDMQKEKVDKPHMNNIPIPMAMNGHKNEIKQEINKKPEVVVKDQVDKVNINNGVINKLGPAVSRPKREVIDCTQKATLKSEDKEICQNLIDIPKNLPEVLPRNVNFNEMALPKNLPMDSSLIEHIGRSLKSYDESKER